MTATAAAAAAEAEAEEAAAAAAVVAAAVVVSASTGRPYVNTLVTNSFCPDPIWKPGGARDVRATGRVVHEPPHTPEKEKQRARPICRVGIWIASGEALSP